MTATLTKPRTASIIVDTNGDGFKIQHMLFIGDDLEPDENWCPSPPRSARVATFRTTQMICAHRNRSTTVFITISAAKRMTDEQIAAIQQAALETRT